jgi:hypothetical protein
MKGGRVSGALFSAGLATSPPARTVPDTIDLSGVTGAAAGSLAVGALFNCMTGLLRAPLGGLVGSSATAATVKAATAMRDAPMAVIRVMVILLGVVTRNSLRAWLLNAVI